MGFVILNAICISRHVLFFSVGDCSFLRSVQTGSGAQPASYLMGTGGSFPRDKTAAG
jgi:hypothetical protein